jgi:uncharacterized protein (TIGR02246 family)
MSNINSEDIARAFVERINARDADGLAELMTEDFTFVDYEGDAYAGRGQMREGFAEYFQKFPEYKIHVHTVCRSGNDVALIGRTTGSHVGPEVEAAETVIWIAEIDGGLVSSWRIYATAPYRADGS